MQELKFKGNSPFSNYYPCKVYFDGIVFLSSEAAYQSHKTNKEHIWKFFSNLSPDDSKALGRALIIREDWEEIKYKLMYNVIACKFTQNPELLQLLLKTTGSYLVEDTTGWHDNIWGNCDCPVCRNIKGQNLLGRALTEFREDYLRGIYNVRK